MKPEIKLYVVSHKNPSGWMEPDIFDTAKAAKDRYDELVSWVKRSFEDDRHYVVSILRYTSSHTGKMDCRWVATYNRYDDTFSKTSDGLWEEFCREAEE